MYKILVIEDEEIIRNGIKKIIDWETIGCRIVGTAANGEEGLKQMAEILPDIVLVDISMPIMGGLEFLEKALELYTFVPIIISGYSEFEYAQQSISLGVLEYLLKPLDDTHLLVAVEKAKQKLKVLKPSSTDIENIAPHIQFANAYLSDKKNISQEIIYIIEYIEDNYKYKIKIDDLVEELKKSKTYLNQKFRNQVHTSFNEYLNRYRITKAIELIVTTDEKIAWISESVGFNNYRYFVEVFRKYTKELPSEYKAKYVLL